MTLAEMYAREFQQGGKKSCVKCGKPSHGKWCSFCIDKELRACGVSKKTMRIASAVFRRGGNTNQAIAAIEREISK